MAPGSGTGVSPVSPTPSGGTVGVSVLSGSSTLKSRTITPPDEDKIGKDNPHYVEFAGRHWGISYSEKAANPSDLIIVDIDNYSVRTYSDTLRGSVPMYNIALTKDTLKKVILEGFLVRKAKTDEVASIDYSTGDIKYTKFKR